MAKEIFTTAGVMWALTLTGLGVGFGLLKIQGEQRLFNTPYKIFLWEYQKVAGSLLDSYL